MDKNERVKRYNSFSDDFFETRDQEYKLPEDYLWIRKDVKYRFLSSVIYGLALVFGVIYCRLFLHVRIKGRKKLKAAKKTGAFIYGNHTQPVGDVFIPALAAFPKRIYTVVSTANMAIPFIGKILPYLGALPIPDTVNAMKQFNRAVESRVDENKCVVIYPEAHVWEYCTFVRPFPDTSFRYAVKYNKPAYCMTTTYQKRRFGKKPAATVYIDGPFTADKSDGMRENAAELRNEIHSCMTSRGKMSTYEFIKYVKND